MFHFSQLSSITKGEILMLSEDLQVEVLVTDSRKTSVIKGAIFIAIKGDFHDGHEFIDSMHAIGIRQFIVEKGDVTTYNHLEQSNILKVQCSITALQRVAQAHREKFSIPIIGVTGSNGKTIVKEWLSQILSSKFRVVKSPKSYNSQLGVPLSVWHLSGQHQIGVFEAGISKSGEMEQIELVMQPSIGIFTNIGSAHDKGFSSREEKILEKVQLFKNSQAIICCKDHEDIHQALIKYKKPKQKLFTWSTSQPADIQIRSIHEEGDVSIIDLMFYEKRLLFKVPFHDQASYENCINCIGVCLYLNLSEAVIQEQIMALRQVSMRLALKEGINGCYVIDDTYNNDIAGLKIALDFLMLQHQKSKKTVILSDIFEAGLSNETLYQKVADLIESKHIDRFIGIGKDIESNKHLFSKIANFYHDKEQFLKEAHTEDFNEEVILIKGARKYAFEEIVEKFQRKIHGTIMEINLDAMTHNLNYFRNLLKRDVKLLVMVKAFAYGSGFLEIANFLQFHGVDYLGVAYPDEGIMLRENGIRLPIMVMNASPESFPKLIENDLEPEIYSLGMMKTFANYLDANSFQSRVHIKLETGMHRLGFAQDDLSELIDLLKGRNNIEIASIFSHLAGSEDEEHNDFSQRQFDLFEKGFQKLEHQLSIQPLKHILKSSGIIRFPDRQYDMVRLGIGLHGIGFNKAVQKELEPVASLKTTISQIISVNEGDTIGYDRKGKADHPMEVATIAIGYADGFDRRFSNGVGEVIVKGKSAPVLGNICMDMCMIDVTNIDVNVGDQVVIFGNQLPLVEMADRINCIPYEILTKVSGRVKRVFYIE